MQAKLTILGSSSATPTKSRFHSAQYLTFGKECVLIDCGEGTQNRMLQYGLNFQKINQILISHMHGDHYLGLPGLINSMALNQRTRPLTVYGPKGLGALLDMHFELGKAKFLFDLEVVELADFQVINLDSLSITVIPVVHRIPCNSFIIREINQKRKLNILTCEAHDIPVSSYEAIKSGQDFIQLDGTRLSNKMLTFDPPQAFSYAYVTDTLYQESNIRHFKGIRVVYHEATYLNNLLDRALMTFHSTSGQAATFALKCGASQLIIGHFSSRYDSLIEHLEEAKAIFSNTELAEEGKSFDI